MNSEYSTTAFIDVLVGVGEENSLPTEFSLLQNYPNPFNPSTTIKYSIPIVETLSRSAGSLQNVQLKVYDILGHEVATLVNKTQREGNYEATFDASNLVSGIYFYKLTYGSFSESKKMLLIK